MNVTAGIADVVDRGTGAPLVLVPGVQGRWEYMGPAVEALAERFRVITFSLTGERRSGRRFDPAKGFDNYCDQIEDVLDARGVDRAIVCGVSFGGLVALRFAARHGARAAALVLVSTPGPGWHLKARHEVYARLPWIFGPVFLAEAPWRLRDELRVALPDPGARRRFKRAQLRTLLRAPLSVSRMARRARLIADMDGADESRQVACPTLVLTGEPALDHVVAAEGASAYGALIPGARTAILRGTGHLGLVTKPDEFARTIRAFADELSIVTTGSAHDAA